MAPKESRRRKAPSVQDTKTPTKKPRTEKTVEVNGKKAEAAVKQRNKKPVKETAKIRGGKSNAAPKKSSKPDEGETSDDQPKKAVGEVAVKRKKPSRAKQDEEEGSATGDVEPVAESIVNDVNTVARAESVHRVKNHPRKIVEGNVWTCGQGDVGQLGLGVNVMEQVQFACVPGLRQVVDICAGGMHTVCLTSDGTVYTFGCDDEGALGRQATDETCFVPEQVQLEAPAIQISAGDSHSAALLEDGRVFAWGSFRDSHGTMGLRKPHEISKTPALIALATPVEKIASGSDHLILLTETGQLFSCGCPEQGQLGRITARSASRDCRCGMATFLTPQPIILKKNPVFKDIWASSYGTYAKERSNVIYRCGLNNYHQLGLPTEGPIFQPQSGLNSNQYVKLEGGEHHTILLDNNGKVYCLGRKEYGRLGLGRDTDEAHVVTEIEALQSKKCVDIAAGSAVSFAVTEDGTVYGWGMGSNYQLCAGGEDDIWEPRLISTKGLKGKQVLLAAAGGQHSVLLVKSNQENSETN